MLKIIKESLDESLNLKTESSGNLNDTELMAIDYAVELYRKDPERDLEEIVGEAVNHFNEGNAEPEYEDEEFYEEEADYETVLREVKKELGLTEAVGLKIENPRVEDDMVKMKINGKEYGYKHDTMSAQELLDKYNSICKHNEGRAYSWLKAHSKLVLGGKQKNESLINEEEYSYQEIINRMENATSYDELYDAANLIKNNSIRMDVEEILDECQADMDDVEVAYSIVCSDCLDSVVNELNESRVCRTLHKGDKFKNANGIIITIIDVDNEHLIDGEAQVTYRFEDGSNQTKCYKMSSVNGMLEQNGYKMINESKKLKESEDNTIFIPLHRVVYEGIERISENTGLTMVIEEIDQASDTVTTRISGDEEAYKRYTNYIAESKKTVLKENNEGNQVEVMHFNNKLNEVREMFDIAFDKGNNVLIEKYLEMVNTMTEKYQK